MGARKIKRAAIFLGWTTFSLISRIFRRAFPFFRHIEVKRLRLGGRTAAFAQLFDPYNPDDTPLREGQNITGR